MILKQIIKYDNAPALEATWVTRTEREVQVPDFDPENPETIIGHHTETVFDEVVVRCHAYSNGQMNEMRADLGADAAKYEAMIAEIEATYVEPEPPVPQPINLSSLVFLDLFTQAEQELIAGAAMVDVQAKLWYDRTLAAEFITTADPRTAAGLNALVAMGLLTVERKNDILGAMVA